ncbi:hypothetical protein [Streptomyces sp. NPDC040750]|uniref:hypothetical protein n=1 Tax=Streptomyces sp. NPDC040750 TaxID=3154491 RepID=UPI0033FFDB7F
MRAYKTDGKTSRARAGAALLATVSLALTAGLGIAAATPAAAASGFKQKVTCSKGAVRTQPYGKGKTVLSVYEKKKDWGYITKQALHRSGPLKGTTEYWYGTWHHGKTARKGWVKLACADPRV